METSLNLTDDDFSVQRGSYGSSRAGHPIPEKGAWIDTRADQHGCRRHAVV